MHRITIPLIGLLSTFAWAQDASAVSNLPETAIVPEAEPPAESMDAAQTNGPLALPAIVPTNPPAPIAPPEVPGAMLDGHPREGAFLSGPGSLTFVLHHTLMAGLGGLATQMVPRLIDANCWGRETDPTCVRNSVRWTGTDARVAYLAGTLVGAAVGFGSSAWWQFNHWMSERTANFGIVNSLVGGMFAGGLTDVFTHNAVALSWVTLAGSLAGAWLTAVVGGGELAMNRGALITSGAAWAMIYTALIVAILSSSGASTSWRSGLDAVMITPALGAGAMALASLKFKPSTAQIMRANVFGVGVGGAVLLLSALVLGANFSSPVPYVLSGVGAIGAKTIVSLLWAEAAETNDASSLSASDRDRYRGIW